MSNSFAKLAFGLVLGGLLAAGVLQWMKQEPGGDPKVPVVTPPVVPTKVEPPHFRFRAAGPEAGLNKRVVYGAADPREKRISPEVDGGGVGIFDADGDGWLDIWVANGAPGLKELIEGNNPEADFLYRNNGDGTFTEMGREMGIGSRGWSKAFAFGDIDNDGDEDVFVTALGSGTFFLNLGDGRFQDVSMEAGIKRDFHWMGPAAFGDYDNDAQLDLYVVNYAEYDPHNPVTAASTGAQECQIMGRPITCPPWLHKRAPDVLYRNTGAGTFQDVSLETGLSRVEASPGQALVFLDIDANGYQDIFVGNDAYDNHLHYNLGAGVFQEIGVQAGCARDAEDRPQGTMGGSYADINGDGYPEILVTNHSNQFNPLYENKGGRFRDATRSHPPLEASFNMVSWGIAWQDLDCDGWLDMVQANGETNPYYFRNLEHDPMVPWEWEGRQGWVQQSLVFHGAQPGTFEHARLSRDDALRGFYAARGLTSGDLDRDGDLDLVYWVMGGPPVLLWNESPRGRFITFVLEGDPALGSNRSAYGARVTIQAGGFPKVRWCHSDGSYYSAESPWVHFGLGAEDKVGKVEIRWPSGRTETLENLESDAFYRVKEGTLKAERIAPQR